MKFDPLYWRQRMELLMSQGVGIVLCLHQGWELKGAIAGVVYENVFDGGLCATELFWYVWPGAERGAGTALLEAFEEWARFRKCTRITMAYMHNNMPDRLGPFYEKRGYQAFETHYVKAL
jgi:GNAT superfamily N-acetyltransferase